MTSETKLKIAAAGIGILQAFAYAFACHGLGLNRHGFALVLNRCRVRLCGRRLQARLARVSFLRSDGLRLERVVTMDDIREVHAGGKFGVKEHFCLHCKNTMVVTRQVKNAPGVAGCRARSPA